MRFIFALLLFLSVTFAQVNDKNFKEKINGGVVVAVFTSEWQEQELDEKVLKGVSGYQDCKVLWVKSEQAKKVVKKYGKLDILVNNAAIFASLDRKPFEEISVNEWDSVMSVNLRGVFLCAKAASPIMKAQNYGKIIN